MTPQRQAAGDLFLAFYANETNFTSMLFRLLAKADYSHLRRLALGFPVEAKIFEEWKTSNSAREFFAKYEIHGAIRHFEKNE